MPNLVHEHQMVVFERTREKWIGPIQCWSVYAVLWFRTDPIPITYQCTYTHQYHEKSDIISLQVLTVVKCVVVPRDLMCCGHVHRKILTTGSGSGSQPVAAALSNLTGPAPWYSRRPLHWSWLTRRLVHLSLLPSQQAGRAATEVSLFDPPVPAASDRVWSVAVARLPPVSARLSPTTPPMHGSDSRGLNEQICSMQLHSHMHSAEYKSQVVTAFDLQRNHTIRRRFGPEPEPTGSGLNPIQ